MISVSLCMIVKNEESVLARCLDSIADLVDEMIIVDTGSTDQTKTIARRYTDQIYDYTWTGDFGAARNYSFSKATKDYIYCADADEILDEENRQRFLELKQVLLPEIEIVQMKYVTASGFNTVLNYQKEYRPKLFRRLRTFQWIDPIHETVRTAPVVYDSEIEILHKPQSLHSSRDFHTLLAAFTRDGQLSFRIQTMYAKELFISGMDADFLESYPVFAPSQDSANADIRKEGACVLAHIYRIQKNVNAFFKLALKDMITTPCAEICCELGLYFEDAHDYPEAVLWFYNAAHETESILDVRTSSGIPLLGLSRCYEKQAALSSSVEEKENCLLQAKDYAAATENWTLPIE